MLMSEIYLDDEFLCIAIIKHNADYGVLETELDAVIFSIGNNDSVQEILMKSNTIGRGYVI